MAARVAFIICTEPEFERKSVLLVRSIRRFAGCLSAAPIYSFSPRQGYTISQWVVGEFLRLGVEHSDKMLNARYTNYGVYNKPFVCAFSERHIDTDVLIFLDSDQVIFNEPDGLLITDEHIAAARPVNLVNIGVRSLRGGKDEEYWRKLYELCEVRTFSIIRPTLDDCEILAYFNSGLISTRRRDGVWARWAGNFERVMRVGLQPTEPFFIEQSVFSATLSSMDKPVAVLPASYNYPLPAHFGMLDSHRIKRFEEVVSIHYHRVFDQGNWLPFLTHLPCFEKRSLRYEWLLENLAELDT